MLWTVSDGQADGEKNATGSVGAFDRAVSLVRRIIVSSGAREKANKESRGACPKSDSAPERVNGGLVKEAA